MIDLEDEKEKDVFIFDTGGVNNSNITKRVWRVIEYKINQQELFGYQHDIMGEVYHIVNALTKGYISDRDVPVWIVLNYANMIDNKEEKTYPAVQFDMMRHGFIINFNPRTLVQYGGVFIKREHLPFWWENE